MRDNVFAIAYKHKNQVLARVDAQGIYRLYVYPTVAEAERELRTFPANTTGNLHVIPVIIES